MPSLRDLLRPSRRGNTACIPDFTIASAHVLKFSYIDAEYRSQVPTQLRQTSASIAANSGSESGTGAVPREIAGRNNMITRIPIEEFDKSRLDSGYVARINHVKDITDVLTIAEVKPGQLDGIMRNPRDAGLIMMGCNSQVEEFNSELLSSIDPLGSLTIFRIVLEELPEIDPSDGYKDLKEFVEKNIGQLSSIGYDSSDPLSLIRGSFLLWSTASSHPWYDYVCIECRPEPPIGPLGISWTNEYILPLSVYPKIRSWQERQSDSLENINEQLDAALDQELGNGEYADQGQIGQGLSALNQLHNDWGASYSRIRQERRQVSTLLSYVEQDGDMIDAYETPIRAPNAQSESPLLTLLSETVWAQFDDIETLLETTEQHYNHASNLLLDRTQNSIALSNLRRQNAVVWLTVALFAFGVIQVLQILSNSNMPEIWYIILIMILVELLILSFIGTVLYPRSL